ncbi:FAD binding domain-containing protein [Goodfellowiella coeruleoviolacea]|uniref:FAD binding domain-containing protein n=1 Tax=Goodfellowiella coeruleoviolacea TaxID=334858 RepID=A0AAE3GHA8_9PSEU|nr:FAD binding domain-containing protein [Goodfellowiella coeruleoviolacea]
MLFTDRAPVAADLVVGADGAHSIVARHLAGGPTNRPAGIIGFSGRTLLADLSASERRRLGPRSGLVVGPRGTALYIGFLDPLGDAVRATPPTAGMGAGAAIRDAASLAEHLTASTAGTTTLSEAIHRFETGMRERGGEVLTLAMRTVRWILATDTTLGAAATAVGAPVLAAAARLLRH